MNFERELRSEFPQLKALVNGHPLVYLDSAATALKPRVVIEATRQSLAEQTANVHRGAHWLSDQATEKFEAVRENLQIFLGAEQSNEIVFTSGTTGGLNLLAQTLGRTLNDGDEILLSQMEHHSNIVPWQMVAKERQAKVCFAPVNPDGTLNVEAFKKMLSPRVKIVSLVHLSNALGVINPVAELFLAAHASGAVTVLDAAQSVAYAPIDVNELGCDFLVFSGHKLFAPTGVGVLYGRWDLLSRLPPYQGGGSMINEVREDGVDFLPAPHRFEAGTPPIAQVMGLGAALSFVQSVGRSEIQAHAVELFNFADSELARISGLRRVGVAGPRANVLSFLLEGQHPSDIGAILDQQGIAVRAGHHCCQPLMRSLGISGTVRASLSLYTSHEDIEALVAAIKKTKELLT